MDSQRRRYQIQNIRKYKEIQGRPRETKGDILAGVTMHPLAEM